MSHQNLLSDNGHPDYDVVSFEKGGFEASSQEEIAEKLGIIHKGMLGKPNGVAYAGLRGVIPSYMLDTEKDLDTVCIKGPLNVNATINSTFRITNYDILTTYTLTAISGTVSRNKDIITFTPPSTGTSSGFILNGYEFVLTIDRANYVNKPSITSPSTDQIQVGPDISLTSSAFSYTGAVDSFSGIEWQFATSSLFEQDSILAEYSGVFNNLSHFTKLCSSLPVVTNVYSRVRHIGNTHGVSQWSDTRQLTTKGVYKPSTPSLIQPVDGITDTPLTVAAGSSSYDFANSSYPLYRVVFELWTGNVDTGTLVTSTENNTSLNYGFTALTPNTNYFVRVKHVARDPVTLDLYTSDWSNEVSFTTVVSVIPNTPTVLTPSDNSTGYGPSNFTATWSGFVGKFSDTCELVEYRLKTSIAATYPAPIQLAANAVSATITGLAEGTTYNFQVRVKGTLYGYSNWSNVLSFSTMSSFVSKPSVSMDSNVVDSSHVYTFIGSAYSGAGTLSSSEWEVTRIGISGFDNDFVVTHTTTTEKDRVVSNIPVLLSDLYLLENRSYKVRMRRTNNLGNVSLWSDYFNFTTAEHFLMAPSVTIPDGSTVIDFRSFSVSVSNPVMKNLADPRAGSHETVYYVYNSSNPNSEAASAAVITNNGTIATFNLGTSHYPEEETYWEGSDLKIRYAYYIYAQQNILDLGLSARIATSPLSLARKVYVTNPNQYSQITGIPGEVMVAKQTYPSRVITLKSGVAPGTHAGTEGWTFMGNPDNYNVVTVRIATETGALVTEAQIIPPTQAHNSYSFGGKVRINNSGNLIFVSADDGELTGFDSGFISVFKKLSNGAWVHAFDVSESIDHTFASFMELSPDGTRLFVSANARPYVNAQNPGSTGNYIKIWYITQYSVILENTISINDPDSIRGIIPVNNTSTWIHRSTSGNPVHSFNYATVGQAEIGYASDIGGVINPANPGALWWYDYQIEGNKRKVIKTLVNSSIDVVATEYDFSTWDSGPNTITKTKEHALRTPYNLGVLGSDAVLANNDTELFIVNPEHQRIELYNFQTGNVGAIKSTISYPKNNISDYNRTSFYLDSVKLLLVNTYNSGVKIYKKD